MATGAHVGGTAYIYRLNCYRIHTQNLASVTSAIYCYLRLHMHMASCNHPQAMKTMLLISMGTSEYIHKNTPIKSVDPHQPRVSVPRPMVSYRKGGTTPLIGVWSQYELVFFLSLSDLENQPI